MQQPPPTLGRALSHAAKRVEWRELEHMISLEDRALVVFCDAPWHAGAVATGRIFAEAAAAHSGAPVRAVRCDVSRYPAAAARLGVDASGSSRELPAVVALFKGEQIARLPKKGTPMPRSGAGLAQVTNVRGTLGMRLFLSCFVKCSHPPCVVG